MVTGILRPASVREALRMGRRPGAAWLGGGTWLNSPWGGSPRILVSLERLGLDAVECAGAGWRIGASVTLQRIVDSPGLPEAVRRAAALTAARPLRNMATLGGEMGLRPRDSLLIPVLMALDAEVLVAGRWAPRGMEEHCRGAEAALVLGIRIPEPRPCAVEAVSLSSRSPRTLVAAVGLRGGAATALSGVRIAMSDCCGQSLRLRAAEEALEGRPIAPKKAVEAAVHAAFWPNADIHASGAYKRYLAGVLAADMLHALAGGTP